MKSFGRLLALLIVCTLMASVMSSEYQLVGRDPRDSTSHCDCEPIMYRMPSRPTHWSCPLARLAGKLLKDEGVLQSMAPSNFHGDLSDSLDAFLGNLTQEFQSFVGESATRGGGPCKLG